MTSATVRSPSALVAFGSLDVDATAQQLGRVDAAVGELLGVAAAIPQASMIGSVRVKLPVISTTLAIAVSGAWAAPANTPPIATTRVHRRRPDRRSEDVIDDHAEGHARQLRR